MHASSARSHAWRPHTRLGVRPGHPSGAPTFRRRGRVLTLAGAAIACLALLGCAPPVWEGGFDAPDPASQAYAIERSVRENDRTKIPRIIETLDSDDSAVRFLAINALYEMTGTTMGYRYYDPPMLREAAIQRWVDWANQGMKILDGKDAQPQAVTLKSGAQAADG